MSKNKTNEITQKQQMIDEIVEDLVATKTDIALWLKFKALWEFKKLQGIEVKPGDPYLTLSGEAWDAIQERYMVLYRETEKQVDNFKQKLEHFQEAEPAFRIEEAETELQAIFDSVRKPVEEIQ
tara:strand:- start:1504 stop:1875 length:372 start_codon:yes stop_codon:yes gene_type:complete